MSSQFYQILLSDNLTRHVFVNITLSTLSFLTLLPPLFSLAAANRGRGYSEVHLKDLRDTIVPALEVNQKARRAGNHYSFS